MPTTNGLFLYTKALDETGQRRRLAYYSNRLKRRGPTPERGWWTAVGPSSAEGCFLMAGDFVSGWAGASPTLPGMMPFRVAISTAPDPQGSGRVDIFTHPSTTAACAAVVETGTTGRDSSRYRHHGNGSTRQQTSWIANAMELNLHMICTKIRAGVVSFSLVFLHPPEDKT